MAGKKIRCAILKCSHSHKRHICEMCPARSGVISDTDGWEFELKKDGMLHATNNGETLILPPSSVYCMWEK